MVRHGTHSAYSRGCRCDECKSFHTEYHRAYRHERGMPEQPNRQGRTVRVDGHALRVYALSVAPSLGAFAINCGLSRESLYKVVKRGTTTEATLDRVSCYLGIPMSSLEVT